MSSLHVLIPIAHNWIARVYAELRSGQRIMSKKMLKILRYSRQE